MFFHAKYSIFLEVAGSTLTSTALSIQVHRQILEKVKRKKTYRKKI